MKLFVFAFIVLLAVISPSICVKDWSRDIFNTDKIEWSKNENGIVTNYVNHTGYWEVGNQDHCTISNYLRIEITDPTSTTVPPNNGVAQCTQQDCDKTSDLAPIDCATAFGDKLSQIEI